MNLLAVSFLLVAAFFVGGLAAGEAPDPEGAQPAVGPEKAAEPAEAGEAQGEAEGPRSWWEGDFLTGDWKGARAWGQKRGLDFELLYTGEVMCNTRGGRNTAGATEYLGTVDLTAQFDVEKMGGWRGGTFQLWFENLHGGGISEEHVGDYLFASNLEDRPFSTLYEYWYRHQFWDDRFWIKAGKIDATYDFCASDYGGEFSHTAFGYIPNAILGTYPDPGLAVMSGFRINKAVSIRAMFQDGAPEGKSITGLRDFFDGEGGHVSFFETHLTPPGLPEKLPGTYRFGAWHHTGDFQEISAKAVPPEVSSDYGLYFFMDQRLFKEREEKEDEQGLGLFLQWGWAPEDRNDIEHYVGGGLLYRGPAPGRDEDLVGLGVAHSKFSNRLQGIAGMTQETSLEVFYKVQATPFISLRPQMMYVVNPGGHGRNALAAGLRFEVKF